MSSLWILVNPARVSCSTRLTLRSGGGPVCRWSSILAGFPRRLAHVPDWQPHPSGLVDRPGHKRVYAGFATGRKAFTPVLRQAVRAFTPVSGNAARRYVDSKMPCNTMDVRAARRGGTFYFGQIMPGNLMLL